MGLLGAWRIHTEKTREHTRVFLDSTYDSMIDSAPEQSGVTRWHAGQVVAR